MVKRVIIRPMTMQRQWRSGRLLQKDKILNFTFSDSGVQVVLIVALFTFYYEGGYAMGMCDIDDAIPFVFPCSSMNT